MLKTASMSVINEIKLNKLINYDKIKIGDRMKLENMTITDKINALEQAIEKANSEVEYSIQVKWEKDAEDTKNDAHIFIQNAHTLFASGGIDSLDYDVKADAYASYNMRLDSYLRMFPEFQLDDIITENVPAMHI